MKITQLSANGCFSLILSALFLRKKLLTIIVGYIFATSNGYLIGCILQTE
nr:MAG TPA: hypothetical protein [Caudoviricetes sp.]